MLPRLLLLLFLAACVVSVASAAAFSAPIVHKPSVRTRLINEQRWDELRSLEAKRAASNVRGRRHAQAQTPYYRYDDADFFVKLTIGTPSNQEFHLALDTLVGDIWVVDNNCTTDKSFNCDEWCYSVCDPRCCLDGNIVRQKAASTSCTSKATFDSSHSSTYKSDGGDYFDQIRDAKYVRGIVGSDTVTFGVADDAQVAIEQAKFGQVTLMQYDMEDTPGDGFFGIPYRSVSKYGVQPLFHQAVEKKAFAEPIFTIWLNRTAGAKKDAQAGAITFGLDTEHCAVDEILWQDMPYEEQWTAERGMWRVKVDAYTANEQQGNLNVTAIIDLSRPITYLPPALVDKLYADLNAEYDSERNTYIATCGQKANFSLIIGGKNFPFDESMFLRRLGYSSTCAIDVDRSWYDVYPSTPIILGQLWMKHWCTAFDISGDGRVGFAKALT